MKIFSIYNQKGGVGKTTSTINFAYELNEHGYKILLLDMDPQSDLTKSFNAYNSEKLSMNELLENKCTIDEVIVKTEYNNIDLIPSNLRMNYLENEILLDMTQPRETRLKNKLKDIEDKYDFCLIDCPPRYSSLTLNVLVATDEVIIPVDFSKYALDGLNQMTKSINEIKDAFNHTLEFKGCFLTKDKPNTNVSKGIVEALKNILGEKVFNNTIRDTVAVAESTHEELPVIAYDRSNNSSIDYINLTKEIFNI
jgi:chromosome partitioning protein